jgi:heme exporter protein C
MNSFLSYLISLARRSITRHYKSALWSLSIITILSYIITGVWIFYFTPDDYLQGGLVKIMYIHVPCAWISLASYILLGIFSVIYLIYNDRFCSVLSSGAIVVSLNTCLITLVTGSIWGKAAWGTWWIWDPRLTAVFIQFCLLSVCYMLRSYGGNSSVMEQSVALLTIIGLINIPIIKFAVNAWNSIHQDASVFRSDGIKIHPDLFMPLVMSFIAISCFYLLIGLIVARNRYKEIKMYRIR